MGGLLEISRPAAVWSERVALSAEAFEIIVKGKQTPTLASALEGFEVSRYDQNLTYLVGWVPDQARAALRPLGAARPERRAEVGQRRELADPALDGPGTTT